MSSFKEMLSVLSARYAFNASVPMGEPALVWESVRQELRALAALAPLLRCPPNQEWSTEVLTLDASDTGFGVVMREAIRNEACYGEKKGWVVEADRVYSESEYFAEWDKRDSGRRAAGGPSRPRGFCQAHDRVRAFVLGQPASLGPPALLGAPWRSEQLLGVRGVTGHAGRRGPRRPLARGEH